MSSTSPGGSWTWLAITALLPLPALLVRAGLISLPLPVSTIMFGLAILGAAFLLTWAAEAAERDLSGPVVLALLALVALLPEYAVDMYFAWSAADHPDYAAYAAANMTGANRLLIGFGWATVVLVFWLKTRQSPLVLARHHALELCVLAAATLYAFVLPLKHSLSPFDSVFLIGLFAIYIVLAARSGISETVDLVGPAERIGALPRRNRRALVVTLFAYAAAIILLTAEAFADGLVETGTRLGIDRFLLVQWLAPLASEAPEFIAATLLCLRGRAGNGMGVLLSSTVNQWTLLVGGLPLAYSLAKGGPAALPLDGRQTEELLLTAAQSLFAVAILLNLSLSVKQAGVLLALFLASFALQQPAERYLLIAIYVILSLVMFWRQRLVLRAAVRQLGTRPETIRR